MNRPELTYEEFCALPFVFRLATGFDWGSQRICRNEAHGLTMECVTKRVRYDDIYSGWQEEQISYFLDGDKREFQTPDQLYVAYMEEVCGIKEKNA